MIVPCLEDPSPTYQPLKDAMLRGLCKTITQIDGPTFEAYTRYILGATRDAQEPLSSYSTAMLNIMVQSAAKVLVPTDLNLLRFLSCFKHRIRSFGLELR